MADWNDQYSSFDWDESYDSDLDVSLDEGKKHHAHMTKITLSVNASKTNSSCPTDQSGPPARTDKSNQHASRTRTHTSDHAPQAFTNTHKRRQQREGQHEHGMHNYPIKDRQDSGAFVSRDRSHRGDKRESYGGHRGRRSFHDATDSSTPQHGQFTKQNRSSFDEQKQQRDNIISSSTIFTRNRQVFSRQGRELCQIPSFKDIRVQEGKTVNAPTASAHSALPSDVQAVPRSSSELSKPYTTGTSNLDQETDLAVSIQPTNSSPSVKPYSEELTPNPTIRINLNTTGEPSPKEAPASIVPDEPIAATDKLGPKDEHRDIDFKDSSHLNPIDSNNISISSVTIEDHDRGSPVRQRPERGSVTSSRISVVFSDGTSLQKDDNHDKKDHTRPHKDTNKESVRSTRSKDVIITKSPKIENKSQSCFQGASESPLKTQLVIETKSSAEETPIKPIRIDVRTKQNPSIGDPKPAVAKINIKIDAVNDSLSKNNSRTGQQENSLAKPSRKTSKQVVVVLADDELVYSNFRSPHIKLPSSVWRIS